ncbi:hypothetical protein [Nocardia iowensis]|uniref:Uncharacterized protein n=1 Tax=Nocardia iowensis TaxID=204891 RepID=A0ABX8RG20_NOCIO|nr:hypothetical protein [Nocardia iowensis]QXN88559.1 hypothetical protein KV110_23490 [Nocardia iowensis]
MADFLQVDLETVLRLGADLGRHADAINAIDHSVVVSMSDGPVAKVFEGTGDAVRGAYRLLGGEIRRMSDTALWGARTYEAMESASTEQLRAYLKGR